LSILDGESFKLRRFTGLVGSFLQAWLSNCVAAYGLAHSMAAYDGGFEVYVPVTLMLYNAP